MKTCNRSISGFAKTNLILDSILFFLITFYGKDLQKTCVHSEAKILMKKTHKNNFVCLTEKDKK